MKTRCGWVKNKNELYVTYHDTEWGLPVHDDSRHFEFLILEGAQAGLSWETILKRREGYRKAFANFDPKVVAGYKEVDFERLVNDGGIIRNRAKILSAINNAQKFLAVQKEFGSFDTYIWQFVEGDSPQKTYIKDEDIPVYTPEAEALSKDLKKRGFTFVGPTVIYAHMQATGLVNDHIMSCFRYREVLRVNDLRDFTEK